MIQLNNLTTGYDKKNPLLKNFSYTFDGKIYGILGHSGCGKTTLLRTIAGLIKPISGEVLVNGNIVGKPEHNEVYMMHQNYTSFDWLKCLDNILISKEIKCRITKQDVIQARVMLNKVRLSGCENKYPRQLSGGMRQRLALARTLFTSPDIILMDEPLSALDPDTRNEMQNLIIGEHIKTHNTIIMVTHSRQEAEKMCDIIIDL